MKEQNKRKLGSEYEDRTEEFLRRQGYEIIARNYRVHRGEIDIIFRDEETIVFAEVKFRSGTGYGPPEEAVTHSKRQTIRQVARTWLYAHGLPESTPCRFDVIAFEPGRPIRHLKDAFGGF